MLLCFGGEMEEIEFDRVDFASAGAIGAPGSRTFMIQGFQGKARVAVLVERHQIELLSDQSIEFLDSLMSEFPNEEYATPIQFDQAAEVYEISPEFRARSMGLVFDPDTLLITLELHELPFDPDEDVIDQFMEEEKIVKLTMTRQQLRAMAVKGREAIEDGRETCILCQAPLDEHEICPRLN